MRTVDLIHRKRDGEELRPEEISFLIDGYTRAVKFPITRCRPS